MEQTHTEEHAVSTLTYTAVWIALLALLAATLAMSKLQLLVRFSDLGSLVIAAVKAGLANLGRHISNVRKFGVPVVVAINHFAGDNEGELEMIAKTCRDEFGADVALCKHWALGGKGAVELAEKVVALEPF